ncbi:MAG: PLP-dependent lyase/thiolase [Acidimicrobiia bacterium]
MFALRCPGCNAVVDPLVGWKCPNAADDSVDHVLVWESDEQADTGIDTSSENPFIRYRNRLHSYALARRLGMADAEFVALVEHLDAGLGFRRTPFVVDDVLGGIKDETGNVAGSHKGRHLFGVLLHLELRGSQDPLAIASCGNAALAAATIAHAVARRLTAYVPVWADEDVVARLRVLGAEVVHCERRAGESGDPSVRRFREAVADGAVPFSCQGTDNALTIDGGRTIGWELAEQLQAAGYAPDAVFVQVGGGALASAVAQSIALPLYAVQSEGCAPLVRAHTALRQLRLTASDAARRRRDVMWAWEHEPQSVAEGILDDETYDWRAILHAIEERGGGVIAVSEDQLMQANELAQDRGFSVSTTGSAGLAGRLPLLERHPVAVSLFTGR